MHSRGRKKKEIELDSNWTILFIERNQQTEQHNTSKFTCTSHNTNASQSKYPFRNQLRKPQIKWVRLQASNY